MENEHIEKTIAAMGIAQNVKKEENVIATRGDRTKSVGADMSGTPCGRMECVPCFFGRHSQTEAVCYDDHDFQRVSDVRCASRHEHGTMRPITIPTVSFFFSS